MVPPNRIEGMKRSLNKNKIIYYILIADVQKYLEEDSDDGDDFESSEDHYRQKRDIKSFFSKYRSKNKIYNYLKELARKYPSLITVQDVGHTYKNNSLQLVKITKKSNSPKPIIWIDGGTHARELIAPATAMYFIYKLLNDYGTDDEVTNLVNTFVWYIMPLVNPDGYEYVFKGHPMWRKNRSKGPSHCKGVDLNRNFPFQWNGTYTPPKSRNPNEETYIGPSPLSEKETQTISNILQKIKRRVKLFITFHSYGQFIAFPWFYQPYGAINDYTELLEMGKQAAKEIKTLFGTEYTVGKGGGILYPAPGTSADWAYETLGIKYSYIIELRDKGKRGFELSKKKIIPVGEETWKGVRYMASAIGKTV